MNYYINTMIFRDINAPDHPQSRQIAECAAAGYSLVEVRREFFFDLEHELAEARCMAEMFGTKLIYSVPYALFAPDGEFQLDVLRACMREADSLGAEAIKLTLGEYKTISDRDLTRLERLAGKRSLLVENGASGHSGVLCQLALFLNVCAAHEIPMGLTFDTGNFVRRGVPLTEAVSALGSNVSYIHLKDLKGNTTMPLGQGEIDFSPVLSAFPDSWAAAEYACGKEDPLGVATADLARMKH